MATHNFGTSSHLFCPTFPPFPLCHSLAGVLPLSSPTFPPLPLSRSSPAQTQKSVDCLSSITPGNIWKHPLTTGKGSRQRVRRRAPATVEEEEKGEEEAKLKFSTFATTILSVSVGQLQIGTSQRARASLSDCICKSYSNLRMRASAVYGRYA